ncbi:hypothetical protein, partial [Streptomyces xinghaiensis]|uniref:hypothetical protein n=1 Tax=Streptomyces xinghaiensis TaxID=1038928 RepID=UPI001A7E9811
GVVFGGAWVGSKRRAEEVDTGDLPVAPELVPIFKAPIKARHDVLITRIKTSNIQIGAVARCHKAVAGDRGWGWAHCSLAI